MYITLTSDFPIVDLSRVLKSQFRGLKKLIENNPNMLRLGGDHSFNPHVYLVDSPVESSRGAALSPHGSDHPLSADVSQAHGQGRSTSHGAGVVSARSVSAPLSESTPSALNPHPMTRYDSMDAYRPGTLGLTGRARAGGVDSYYLPASYTSSGSQKSPPISRLHVNADEFEASGGGEAPNPLGRLGRLVRTLRIATLEGALQLLQPALGLPCVTSLLLRCQAPPRPRGRKVDTTCRSLPIRPTARLRQRLPRQDCPPISMGLCRPRRITTSPPSDPPPQATILLIATPISMLQKRMRETETDTHRALPLARMGRGSAVSMTTVWLCIITIMVVRDRWRRTVIGIGREGAERNGRISPLRSTDRL